MIRRTLLTAALTALTLGATVSVTACADSTAPRSDCQIINGSVTCTGH